MANTLNLGNGNWATKEDSLLAYNSENGNFKPLPFDFTRASSATVVNKDGLIETVGSGEPRIDFSNDAKGALLLEPTRSNLIPYSEAFDNAYWTKSGSSVTSGFTSPKGDLSAFKLVEGTNTGVHYIYKTSVTVIAGKVTLSIRAKAGERNWIALRETASATGRYFDLTNGVLGGVYGSAPDESTIKPLANGWYDISITVTAPSTTVSLFIYMIDVDGGVTYTGDGTSEIYIYGAQLEQGSYATSYIPTSGSAVTRVVDACNNGGNEQVINSTEGVLYAEISALANDLTLRKIQLNDNTGNNNVTIDYYSTTNTVRANLWNGTSQYSYVHTLTDITSFIKIAFLYNSNSFKLYIDGIKVNESFSGSTFASGTLKKLDLSTSSGTSAFYGNTKDLRVYNTALTDAELQALTK